jgi:hypothetical protein
MTDALAARGGAAQFRRSVNLLADGDGGDPLIGRAEIGLSHLSDLWRVRHDVVRLHGYRRRLSRCRNCGHLHLVTVTAARRQRTSDYIPAIQALRAIWPSLVGVRH